MWETISVMLCQLNTLFCFLEFYNEMPKELSDLKLNDVTSYKPLFLPAMVKNFRNYTILSSNEGTGGPILIKVLNMINNNTLYDDLSRDISLLNTFKGK